MRTVNVTEWNHPTFDMTLILAGSAEDTREIAEGFCVGGDVAQLSATEKRMSKKAFDSLTEFDG